MVTVFAAPGVADDGVATFEVTITNLVATQPISPPVVVTHTAGTHFWQMGTMASPGIIAIAEDGEPSVAVAEQTGAANVTGVVNVGQPLTMAGTTFGTFGDSVTIEIDAVAGDVLSVAGMLICSNDAFAGGDSLALPRFGRPATYYLNVYDAGSERNTEQSEDIVDACSLLGPVVLDGDDNGNNNAGIDTFRRVLPHRGVAGTGDLLLAHDWEDPAVMVTVSRVG